MDGITSTTPRAVDTHGAAIYTGWSESFLRKARCMGNIPGVTPGPKYLKNGRKISYLIEELDFWLNSHRQVG